MRTGVIARTARVALVVAAGMLATGCFIVDDVRQAIDEANRETLQAIEVSNDIALETIAPLPNPGSRVETQPATDAGERLSALIQQHADRPQLVNPLRLRYALLLLQQGKENSAELLIDEIRETDPRWNSELLRVLYLNFDALKWWSGEKRSASGMSLEELAKAGRFSAQLVKAGNDSATNYIRSYLHQTAADIRIRQARQTKPRPAGREVLAAAMKEYLSQFDSEKSVLIGVLKDDVRNAQGTMLRWYARVPYTVACAEEAWVELRGELPEFKALLVGLPEARNYTNPAQVCK